MNDTIFSEVFWTAFITSGIAFVLALAKAFYKSKCKSCDICFGLIKIERDTDNEEKIDELIIQNHGTNSRDEKENNV